MTAISPDVDALLAAPTVSGWDIALAGASILIAWIISLFAKRAVLAVLRKLQGISEGAALLTARIARYAIILVGIGVAFAFLGASVQPLLAVALIVGAIVVLALRGISNNFAAGVVLQTRHPIKVGDEIDVAGFVGAVKELNGRSVVIVTRDGRTVHVPNAQVLESPMVNHSALGHRRSDIQVRAAVTSNRVAELTDLITDAAHGVEGVHKREPVAVLVHSVETDRLTLLVRFWHHPLTAASIVSPVVTAVAGALDGAGVRSTVTSDLPVAPLTPPAEV